MSNLNKSAEELEKLLDKRLDQSEKVIGKQYASLLNEIRIELAKLYEKYESGGVLTYAEMAKYDRLTKFLDYVNTLLGTNYKDLKKTIYDVLGESYLDGYYLTAWAIETDTLSKLNYSAVTSETITAMIENPISGIKLSHRLQKQRADIIYKIQQEVTQGLVKGESYKVMATRLKGALEGDANKAMRIVRTEAHRVQESSKLDSAVHANNNGVIMLKEWNSVEDQRVRHKSNANHRTLNGKKVSIDGVFKQGLGEGPAPGQMGVASHDINCRCFLTYSVEKVEKVDAKELDGMVFETWKKERLKSSK
ncbi:phage minor head protein [Heyndrickxia oleronia]|uniref:phage minor head protein n=1 Tax=Heyndrickxia oleronia TaxID=38875 RepID=UPI001C0EF2A8|nr:phage minor head protein [Heyndrickxia oleronia]MBU5214361.1 phage head morphogenesis protein [Heyndrickxia oleronia]